MTVPYPVVERPSRHTSMEHDALLAKVRPGVATYDGSRPAVVPPYCPHLTEPPREPVAPHTGAHASRRASRSFGGASTTALSLLRLAWPTSLTGFCTVCLPLVSLVFGGHLGRQELAAVGLATMLANISGYSVLQGLLTAYDTLGSQVPLSSRNKVASACCCWAQVLV